MRHGWFIGLGLFLVSCQMAPTVVRERPTHPFHLLASKAQKDLVLTEDTIILDARPAFDYNLNHVRGSFHLPPENLLESRATGEPLRDARRAVTKLSLMGITPGKPIVVLGDGVQGDGEEGRVAWLLVYFGLSDVQVGANDLFRGQWTQAATPQPENAKPFTPIARKELVVGKEEFKKLVRDPKGRRTQRIHIIDVRSSKEYFNQTGKARPDIIALNIEWKEFYTQDGRPNPSLKKKLLALGIQTSDRIITISERGGRSSAAAYALLALGFSKTQNFVGGWNSLLR